MLIHSTFLSFQGKTVTDLANRIAVLERYQKPDIDTRIKTLTAYGTRKLVDFDQYTALAMADTLAKEAQDKAHPKASFFNVALLALRDRTEKPKAEFHAYFMTLFAGDEYNKVYDTLAKVEKTFKRSSKSTSQSPGTTFSTPQNRPPRPSIPTCYLCGIRGHIAPRCFRNQNRYRPYLYPPRKLQPDISQPSKK